MSQSESQGPTKGNRKPVLITSAIAIAIVVAISQTTPNEPRFNDGVTKVVESRRENRQNMTDAQAIIMQNPETVLLNLDEVTLESDRLASRTYAVRDTNYGSETGQWVAPSGGFIIGGDSVMLINTMPTAGLYKQQVDLLRSISRKPITHAVNTSSLAESTFGNDQLPEDASIVMHQATASIFANTFADQQDTLAAWYASSEEVAPTQVDPDVIIEPETTYEIDLGGRIVQVIDFGPVRTAGDLFVWDELTKTMWAGAAIPGKQPAIVALFDVAPTQAIASLQNIVAFLPDDATIIAGQGERLTKGDVQDHISYLTALEASVAAGIEAGDTLADLETSFVYEPALDYAHYDWIHTNVNIPAVYNENL